VHVQNALARTITHSPRSVPISQLPSNLHWLSIHKRTNFEVTTLTYKFLSTQQPAHHYNLISYHQSSRLLRSSSQSVLDIPRTKTDFGHCAFSSAAPQISSEPYIYPPPLVSPSLDSFKHHLKTYSFTSP